MPGRSLILALAALLIAAPTAALAGEGGDTTDYRLESSVISAGGAPGANAERWSAGTLGQWATGLSANGNHIVISGFWRRAYTATGIAQPPAAPVYRSALFGASPNPFNPITTIRYEVGEAASVEIAIYSVQGRLVRTLVNETRQPGRHGAVWDGRDDSGRSVGSGLYLYRLRIGAFSATSKMLLVK